MIIKKWKTISSEIQFKAKVFRYKSLISQSPTTQKIGKFDIVECLNWVNIVAVTPENKVVMVRQYRHGTDEVTLEFPGGAVNHNEDLLLAAQRELREESGYTSDDWRVIGRVDANPAFMSNFCETYLALNAKRTHELELDEFEEIEVVLKDADKLGDLIKSGEITHSLIIAAVYFFKETSSGF